MSDKPSQPSPAKPKRFKLTREEIEGLRERARQNMLKTGWVRGKDGLWRKPKPKKPADKTD
jgi:hypothetical protein